MFTSAKPTHLNQLFYNCRLSPLVKLKLPFQLYNLLKSLQICSRLPTRRGCRSGRVQKRLRRYKFHLQCCLINARSLQNNGPVIKEYILRNNLDILTVTETWLTLSDGDEILGNICKTGLDCLHVPRSNKRGGGVAIIFHSTIKINPLTLDFTTSSFELLLGSLTINSCCIIIVVVNRPPGSRFCQFIEDFTCLLEMLSNNPE